MASVRLRTPWQKSGESVRSATDSPRLVTWHGPPRRRGVEGPGTTALGAFCGDFARDWHGTRRREQMDRPAPRDKDGLPAPGPLPSEKLSLQHSAGHRNARRSCQQSAGEPAPWRPGKDWARAERAWRQAERKCPPRRHSGGICCFGDSTGRGAALKY